TLPPAQKNIQINKPYPMMPSTNVLANGNPPMVKSGSAGKLTCGLFSAASEANNEIICYLNYFLTLLICRYTSENARIAPMITPVIVQSGVVSHVRSAQSPRPKPPSVGTNIRHVVS